MASDLDYSIEVSSALWLGWLQKSSFCPVPLSFFLTEEEEALSSEFWPLFFFFTLGFCWLLCSWTHLESAAASSFSSFQILSGATCDLWASVGHNCQHSPWSLCQGESPQFCTSLGFWPCSSALMAYKVSKIVAGSQVPEKPLEQCSMASR